MSLPTPPVVVPLSNSDNAQIKFNSAHGILTRILSENNGVVTKKELKQLRKTLNNYVAFGPSGSKFAFNQGVSNFEMFDMSLSDYKNASIGNATLLMHSILEFEYGVDVKNYNTINDISNQYTSGTIGSRGTIKQYCGQIIGFMKGHLTNAGNAPSKAKIVVGEDVHSGNVLTKLMLVYYKNENHKMRVLFIGLQTKKM
jgi:hypothetical protein